MRRLASFSSLDYHSAVMIPTGKIARVMGNILELLQGIIQIISCALDSGSQRILQFIPLHCHYLAFPAKLVQRCFSSTTDIRCIGK
ncbi:hypothetical protein GDO81_012927 [Engystomops pustulosus]|uniref:Uncharacterized protein n=1 Tax=Engystomops pustulosus TaxID=76066 RepID=A0AAV7B1R2_ENGPU|nr:hypothetical protein GDO81_012927 [Engystomops pustulosus]